MSLPDMQLQHLDEIACRFEFQRLSGMGVLAQVGRCRVTALFLPSLYFHEGAREFNFLDPGRTGLYSPASSLVTRLIPALFVANRQRGWAMISLDVADAYLTVGQGARRRGWF